MPQSEPSPPTLFAEGPHALSVRSRVLKGTSRMHQRYGLGTGVLKDGTIYVYTYTASTAIHIYIYIYTLYVSIYIHIYIYTYMYVFRFVSILHILLYIVYTCTRPSNCMGMFLVWLATRICLSPSLNFFFGRA